MVVASVDTASPAPFTVAKRHPVIGAEVRGLDLRLPLEPATVEALKAVWAEHLVLVFPKQDLSEAEQVAFSRNFGELAVHQDKEKISTAVPEILRIANTDEDGNILEVDHELRRYFATLTALWHTDGSYKAVPSLGSILHGREVPPEGGETWFADMFAAYEALPDEVKETIEGRHMVHNHEFNRLICPGLTPTTDQQKRDLPAATHPLVRTHPDGRRSLYVSENVAFYVGGMGLEEGKAYHAKLMKLAIRDEHVYRHIWAKGDVLMWDNRATLHRVTDYDARRHRRVMQRTELLGTEIVR